MIPLPSSQFSDVKPSLQLHVYEPPEGVHCPPFSHGLGKHGEISGGKNTTINIKSLSLMPYMVRCTIIQTNVNTCILFSGQGVVTVSH